jgi:hypothetical protein
MEKKQIILPSKKYYKAPDEDLTIKIGLDNNETLLREGERDIVLDINQLFNVERNECKKYKIHGKLKMIFRNIYSGSTAYDPILKNLYLVSDDDKNDGYIPYNEFAFLRDDVLRESINPSSVSGSTIGTYNPTFSVVGYTGHTSITPIQAPYKNWNLYLSYVYGQDSTYPMKYTFSGGTTYSFTSADGIPFRVTQEGNFYVLTSPVKHGMSQGEYIVISGGTLNSSVNVTGRTFSINEIGNEIFNSEEYVVKLLKSQFKTGYTLSGVTFVLGKRCLNDRDITGTTSQYYVHKHKTVTTADDYILDKAGFESPIWENERKIIFENALQENDVIVERNRMESLIYDFKKPFVLTGITNNLNYTPTDVYLTVIFRNANGYFNYPPKIGYRFNFHDSWIDNHFSGSTTLETSISGQTFTGNTSGFTFTGGTALPTGTTLTGAYVEYNRKEFKERIISEAYHKITHRKLVGGITLFNHGQDSPTYYSGASENNLVGLFYQPHHRIKLRELSPFVETANTRDILNLPENTIFDDKDRLWKWRDVYDHGFIDQEGNGTDFPYLNDQHYVMKDINFNLQNELLFNNKQNGINSFNRYKKGRFKC